MIPTYTKGQQVPGKVKNVTPKLDPQGNHKNFKRGDNTIKYVFNVEFESGFIGEYCYPGTVQPDFVPGRMVEFKVIDVNQWGTTIDIIKQDSPAASVSMGGPSMSGHPAVFAFGFAKDLAPMMKWTELQEVLDGADEIRLWLLNNK